MKFTQRIKQSLEGLIQAVLRYPFTSAFLIATAIVNGISINRSGFDQYDRLVTTFIVGALISLVAQGIFERFYRKNIKRLILAAGAVILTGLYYVIMTNTEDYSMILSIRTAVMVLALSVAFIWVPSIKTKLEFDESFLVVFKSFFTSIFFAGVIMLGVSVIFGATDQLLFNVNYRAYPHAGNIIFGIFAPMYFLSLIPRYHINDEEVDHRINWSRFLEVLVAYIIIPLVSVFTVILVLYILLNIRGEFWTDNLLEPMLVTYSIVVIFVYVLSGTLENKLVHQFKRIFPKVLVPIVLFQTIASALKIQEEGLTHSRYFVLMYGVFAITSGIIFSIYKGKKNGIVAILLIILSIVSIIPPVGAFSVSRRSQINRLEEVLVDNEMLVDGEIERTTEIPEEDRQVIRNTASYIGQMNYGKEISWLPNDFNYYTDFERIFGFSSTNIESGEEIPRYIGYRRAQEEVINISGYQYMLELQFPGSGVGMDAENASGSKTITLQEEQYEVGWEDTEEIKGFYLKDAQDRQVLFIDIEEIVTRLEDSHSQNQPISQEEATFQTSQNGKTMVVIMNFLDSHEQDGEKNYNGDAYVLIGIE